MSCVGCDDGVACVLIELACWSRGGGGERLKGKTRRGLEEGLEERCLIRRN